MASYFSLPPQAKAAAVPLDEDSEDLRKQLGKMSLLSPQVTKMIDDMEDDESSSGSEEGSLSDKPESTHSDKDGKSRGRAQENKPLTPSSLSPRKAAGRAKPPKPKPPHMARFHSLRSMLFSANIEDKMKTATEEDCKREQTAASKWKEQHEQRKMHGPKTPENDTSGKEGFGTRIKTRLRRMTSKDVPTMSQISEDEAAQFDDNTSTASSEISHEPQEALWKQKEDDEKSINHSDIPELVRWVSTRDISNQEESKERRGIKEDSGHESLGNSDVDEIVRWVSKRSDARGREEKRLSQASTESDEDVAADSSEEEDPEDLVRWISHREGPKAGPVRRRKLQKGDLDWEDEQHYDSDIPELGRWVTRQDDTSGESAPATPVRTSKFAEDEPERGRSRSRSTSRVREQRTYLSINDVDELVRWVSRKESKAEDAVPEDLKTSEPVLSKQPEPETGDLRTLRSDQAAVQEIKEKEDEKKQQLGMTMDEKSLSHGDLQELITHTKSLNVGAQQQPHEFAAAAKSTDSSDAAAVQEIQRKEDEKKEQLGMSVEERSLSHSDLQEVITHAQSLDVHDQGDTTPRNAAPPASETEKEKAAVQEIQRKDDEKKEALGMSVEEKSLSHSDLQEVITHVKSMDA